MSDRIPCPSCGTSLGPEHYDPEQNLAHCNVCGEVLGVRFPPPSWDVDGRHQAVEQELPDHVPGDPTQDRVTDDTVPAGISVRDDGKTVVITESWFKWEHVTFVLAGTLLIGIMGPMLPQAIARGQALQIGLSLMLTIFGCVLSLYAVSGMVNKTVITTREGEVVIEQEPLAFVRRRVFTIDDIKELIVRKRTKVDAARKSIVYDVRIELNSGERVPFIKSMHYIENANLVRDRIAYTLTGGAPLLWAQLQPRVGPGS